MGELICLKCKAKSKADTFEQADEQIDHSLINARGGSCNGSPLNMTWNEKPVASIVIHFGPESKDYKPPVIKQVKTEGSESETVKDESKNDSKEDKSDAKPSPKGNSKNSTTGKSK